MKKAEIIGRVTRSLHKVEFKLKKHSPEILVVGGVVGVVASAVLACRATTKLHAVLDDTKEKIDTFHQGVEDGKVQSEVNGKIEVVDYSEEDCTRDITITYVKTGVELIKLYAPAVLLGTASVVSILVGHKILHERNLALAAAYATVDRGFKDYRGRVIERFGKELDRELRYNIKAQEVEEVVTDENGEQKIVKKTVEVANPSPHSDYTRCFDETCIGWTRDAEMNLYFLRQVQDHATDILKTRGWLYWNEVLRMLGIPECRAGQEVGWVYDPKDETRDNYVDFGIYDLHDPQKRLFVNGREKSIWLNFNVDGYILDLMA